MSEENLLEFALCGNYAPEFNPYKAVNDVSVHQILLAIHESKKTVQQIGETIGLEVESVRTHLAELLRCGLILQEKEANKQWYRPSFPIITAEDYQRLQPELDELTSMLVQTTNDLLPEVESHLQALQFMKAGYDAPDLPYIVIGALIFDYGGLAFMKAEELMTLTKSMPGGRYVFTGFESTITELKTSWMWGHTAQFDKYVYTTHGRLPTKGGRKAFPDLFWIWESLLEGKAKSAVKAKATELGAILQALSSGLQTIESLHKTTHQSRFTLVYNLTLLEQLAYIEYTQQNGKTTVILKRPVLSSTDLQILQTLTTKFFSHFKAHGLLKHYQNLNDLYQQTSTATNHIPFKETFNMLYHRIFENALHQLIETKAIHKPPLRNDGAHYSPWLIIIEDDTIPNPFV